MLSDLAVRKAASKEKDYKLYDNFGLYLIVKTNASKVWRFDYRFGGKRKTATFGRYPQVSLADARMRRDDMRKLLAANRDPMAEERAVAERKATEIEDTFENIARGYIEHLKSMNRAQATLDKADWMLFGLTPESIKRKPIGKVTSRELLDVLQEIDRSGRHETAKKLRTHWGSLFRHAIIDSKLENDPTYVLQKSLPKHRVRRMPAIIDEAEFGTLLTTIDKPGGWWSLRLFMNFLALTFVRPVEARFALWPEIDFDRRVWTIPAARMKMREEHQVPLSHQAMSLLREAREADPKSTFIFPSLRTNLKPLSENAANSRLRRLGFPGEKHVSHGFRSSASTMLNRRGFDKEVIEIQLAHAPEDRIRAIYNRDEMWESRVKLMQRWADLLDGMKIL